MDNVVSFVKNLTPSNYFLTKSMEFSKINTSGTLWYLKKFLVLYDAIFLSKRIRTAAGMLEIKNNFESYISTLPELQREEAEKFFFPENIDIRKKYKNYFNFAGSIEFNQYGDINSFMSLVDKYYFVYLMNIGGQSGVKAFIREKLYDENFEVKDLNKLINEYKRNHLEENINVTQIINDYPASLRNERQILFYFGFVHSRNNGARDREFASLTPIGELAIEANYKEFAAIWEHQKIKMISQPLTVEFPSIRDCKYCKGELFELNYSPYLSILKCMDINGDMHPRFYDLVLSRTTNSNLKNVLDHYTEYVVNLNKIKETIDKFGVRSDLASEDFEKEIKKYMLGIRSDFPKDMNKNYFGCVEAASNNGWKITNKEKLHNIVQIYSQIDEYKLKRYNRIFAECEIELKNKYISTALGRQHNINHRIKMSWDLYNIKKDKIILLSLIVNDFIMSENLSISDIDYNLLYNYSKNNFKNIMESISLMKKKDIITSFKEIVERIINKTLFEIKYDEDFIVDIVYTNRYSSLNSDDLLNKIKEVSEENAQPKLEKIRDNRIIDLLNKYYLVNYSDEKHLIECECCGQKTFLKQNDEPYLEFHHLIPFNIANGPDHYQNIFGLCPLCHRKIHYGNDNLKEEIYKSFNKNNHFKLNIKDRLRNLYEKNILKSYHLEYALAEQMIRESDYDEILS